MGHNEMLIGEALRSAPAAAREQALTSVKFGALRDPDGGWSGYDGRPAAVKNFAAYSLQRLGVDHIDIYRIARVDENVPIEETVGAIAELVEAGHVRHIGLSEVGAATLRRAAAVAPISDLQIEYSLISRGIEDEILPTARELGIGVTAYGVLSRGLISGHFSRDRQLAAGDFRGMSPRFQGENLRHNLDLVEALRKIAEQKGVSVAQIAIAWVLAQGPRRRGHRAAGRRAPPGPADRGARRAGRGPERRRPRGDRGGGAGGRGRGRPLPRRLRWPTWTASTEPDAHGRIRPSWTSRGRGCPQARPAVLSGR